MKKNDNRAITIRPFIRKGYRVRLDPRPTETQAVSIAKLIAEKWKGIQEEYKENIAKELGVTNGELRFKTRRNDLGTLGATHICPRFSTIATLQGGVLRT